MYLNELKYKYQSTSPQPWIILTNTRMDDTVLEVMKIKEYKNNK